jgi:antitoxin HigA-1
MDMRLKSSSWTTTSGTVADVLVERRLPKHRPPTHPGEGLRAEFLIPLGIPQSEFARRLGVSFPRLNGIVNGRRGVTTDTALRLARVTGMGAAFWLGLQQDWDLWHAVRSEEARAIAELEPLPAGRRDSASRR